MHLEKRQHVGQAVEPDRLAKKVDRPELQRLVGLGLGRDPRDDHDGDAAVAEGAEPEEIEPAHARQAQIEQDHVDRLALDEAQRLLGRERPHGLTAQLPHEVLEGREHAVLVLDHQDPQGVS